MSSIKLSQLLGEIMWSGKLTFVNAGTKAWSHSINNSLPSYLYPATTWSCCAESAFMTFKASLCHLLWTCYWHCSQSSCWHYGWSCCQHHYSWASCWHHGRSSCHSWWTSILLHFHSCYSCLFFLLIDILVVLGLNWSSLLGSALTELVVSFGHCPWASSSLWMGYPLGAILVFLVCCHLYRWASSFIVLGYVKIINNLNFDSSTMHHSCCCSCLWGIHFHPQSLLGAWHHL